VAKQPKYTTYSESRQKPLPANSPAILAGIQKNRTAKRAKENAENVGTADEHG
jgi:hypothetical protein